MASGLPALPFAGRAAHHGVPCVACNAAEERLVSAAACAAGDAGTEFACALASASSPPIPTAAPAPMAAAAPVPPTPSPKNSLRPSLVPFSASIITPPPSAVLISQRARLFYAGKTPCLSNGFLRPTTPLPFVHPSKLSSP